MTSDIASAHTKEREPTAVVDALCHQTEVRDPVCVLFFASPNHDGGAIGAGLKTRFPTAAVVGCTTAGELTQAVSALDGVSMMVLGRGKVRRAAAALAEFGSDPREGVQQALGSIASRLEIDLRTADPARYVGVILVEGLRGKEEAANAALGDAAPMLSFVGGSAGDNGAFKQTRVYVNGQVSDDGAALLLLDMAVPFVVGKTCSFEPVGAPHVVTRVGNTNRTLVELDGRPVLEVYAEAVGCQKHELNADVFMTNPLGVMIEGKPWIRSPQVVLADGGLRFYCELVEGSPIHVMRSTDLVGDTRRELKRVRETLGGQLSGGLAFNCILRRLELDAKQQHEAFLEAFEGLEVAGFHTYGESWLGHINQTLTGLWFA